MPVKHALLVPMMCDTKTYGEVASLNCAMNCCKLNSAVYILVTFFGIARVWWHQRIRTQLRFELVNETQVPILCRKPRLLCFNFDMEYIGVVADITEFIAIRTLSLVGRVLDIAFFTDELRRFLILWCFILRAGFRLLPLQCVALERDIVFPSCSIRVCCTTPSLKVGRDKVGNSKSR